MSAPTSAPSNAGTTSVASTLPELIVLFNSTWATLGAWTSSIPGSQVAWRYIKASHQDDPFRTVLELLLVFFIVRTYAQSRTKGEQSGKNFVKLTEKEIDELVHEWQPEALLPPAPRTTQYPPVIIGATGPRPRVVFPTPGQDPHDPLQPYDVTTGANQGKVVLNLASSNFAGLAGNERIKDKAVACLKRYGVGSCGPPGFYGTFDVHMELERDIAAFLSVPSVIMYSHSFSTISSVIPSFSKRGDIIVADRGVNFAIQKGIQISRSNIRWYDHGDYEALERILEQIHKEDKKYKRKVTNGRRFIITEGIFENDGSMVDLPKVMELKHKYKYRLILDETWSFGVVGKTGRGVTEVFDIPVSAQRHQRQHRFPPYGALMRTRSPQTAEVDMLVGSMANGLSSTGGFCAGNKEVVAHQRINSPGFVFSAALPPLLAVSASEAISMLSIPANMTSPAHPLAPLPDNVAALRKILASVKPIEIPSAEMSPLIHICIRDDDKLYSKPLTREEQEKLLQDVVEQCAENGVLVTRSKRNWAQEMMEHRPSLRICVTAALTKKEIEKAGNMLKSALNKVLAGKKK